MALRYSDPDSGFRRLGREYAVATKAGKPCMDCGVFYPPYVLQWDHVPGRGRKLFTIGLGDYSVAKVKAEIAKCDLVCANCHAIRTWTRRREQGVAPEAEDWLPVAGFDAEIDSASAVPADVLF